MSRIGKKPVSVPAGVTASVTGQLVKIKGSKGELSFEVPEDVSVTGFDGIRSALDAKLTTVDQPVIDKGRHAARLLLDPSGGGHQRKVTVPTTFLPGATTGPPRL